MMMMKKKTTTVFSGVLTSSVIYANLNAENTYKSDLRNVKEEQLYVNY
jgi:hypothetical protein